MAHSLLLLLIQLYNPLRDYKSSVNQLKVFLVVFVIVTFFGYNVKEISCTQICLKISLTGFFL